MVLKVTRLRRRGFTRRCAPLVPLVAPFPEPFADPLPRPIEPFGGTSRALCGPFCVPFELPIFEKQARIDAGGKPVSADCGYSPRSATSIADGSRSLPTM